MQKFPRIVKRESSGDGLTTPMVDLLIALLVLVLASLVLVGVLLVIRRKRQNRKESQLPVHNGQCTTHHRRITISAPPYANTESIFVIDEKHNLMENSSSPPPSPIPEIRVTLPEEVDEFGKRKCGGVMIVRVGGTGSVGLEPCHDELPPYQSSDAERFQSLDIERMGGLKEKSDANRWS